MAWTIDTVFKFIQFLIRKNQSAGITVQEFQLAWNSEQLSYMSDLLGRFQPRANNKTGQNIGLIQDETILTKISPFINPYNLTVYLGSADKPGNLLYTLAIEVDDQQVQHINHDQKAWVKNDVIDPPSVTDETYYYTELLNRFSFLPSTLTTTAQLNYVATPTDCVWNYSVNVYGRQVYNPTGSVQPQWQVDSIIDISKRTLKSLGVSFKDSDFSQFGQSQIVTGD